jgi:TRAP-type mannitol/chloroaromatic compound transport system permease small subunit
MKRFLRIIDTISDWSGKIICLLVIPMIAIIVYDAVARYAFNAPTNWAYETVTFLFAGLGILGGAYVLYRRAHVGMDIIYSRLSPRQQAILDLLTSFFFFLFCSILLWKGAEYAWTSLKLRETTTSAFAPPLYVIKMTIPVGAFLIILQGLAKFIRDLRTAIVGSRDL